MPRPQPAKALQALIAIARAVSSTADATRLATNVAQHACDVLKCARAAVYLRDRSAGCVPEEDRGLALRAIQQQLPLVNSVGHQVAVPLIVADRFVGMLLAHRKAPATFGRSDLETLRVLGALVAGGLAATSSQERSVECPGAGKSTHAT